MRVAALSNYRLVRAITVTVRTCIIFGVMYLGVMVITAQNASADDAVAKGREIVRQHCTRCHVVPNMNPYGGIGSTPSFAALKWLSDWEHRFEVFYTLPPHPALVKIAGVSEERSESLPAFVAEIELQIDDIDAILSFVRTLETPDQ
jgi:mono/diheme cytochrome c family protein